jgi:hypothetical protein
MKPGSREAGKPGSREAGKPGSREAGKPGSREAGRAYSVFRLAIACNMRIVYPIRKFCSIASV